MEQTCGLNRVWLGAVDESRGSSLDRDINTSFVGKGLTGLEFI